MKYAYNLIEIKSKSDFGFCPQSLKNLRKDLKAYFPEEVKFSAVKFARSADDGSSPFIETTIAKNCLKLDILEGDCAELADQENRVVDLRGELKWIDQVTGVEALRLDDDGFKDFGERTYVHIAYDLTNRVGILYRAFPIEDGNISEEAIEIMLGEDLQDDGKGNHMERLKALGIPKSILKSRGLVNKLPYLT